jgi:hypothetical protein
MSGSLQHHLALALALASTAACAEERRYVGDGVHSVAITEDTAAAAETEEGALYIVERRIDLPISNPAESVYADLQQGAEGRGLPFPRLPWVERGDVEVQIDFTLSSLDDQTHNVGVIVNGYNEFHEYVPGVIEIEDEPVPEFSQWESYKQLGPGQRIVGTIREDELDEVAVDLATVVNGAPSSAEVVYFENHSAEDPRTRPFIPSVVPALVGVRIGLIAFEPAVVMLEVTIRVRDVHGDKLVEDDEVAMTPMPAEFMPVTEEDE